MRKALIAIAVLLVLGVVTLFVLRARLERLAHTPIEASDTAQVEFEVPKGATLQKVGELLEAGGFIRSARVWRIYARIHKPAAPKAGRHKISRSMDLPGLLEALAANPLPDDVPLTLVEGWRLRDIDAHLAAQGLAPAGAFIAAASDLAHYPLPFAAPPTNLEGYLYPETYMVPKVLPLDLHQLIPRLIAAFHERFTAPYAQEIAKSGRTLHELVTMASMLEREEPRPDMRAKVAGVLWKRFDGKWPLGVDATSRYSLAEWNDRKAFLVQLRDPNDPYNTRLKAGLPPGPIGAPSLASLVAALRPEPSEYWYYLHDDTQTIHFAKNAAEHEANRKKYNVY